MAAGSDAIDGGKNKIQMVDQDKCTTCGTCYEVCPPRFGAVQKISGEPVPDPIPEEERIIINGLLLLLTKEFLKLFLIWAICMKMVWAYKRTK